MPPSTAPRSTQFECHYGQNFIPNLICNLNRNHSGSFVSPSVITSQDRSFVIMVIPIRSSTVPPRCHQCSRTPMRTGWVPKWIMRCCKNVWTTRPIQNVKPSEPMGTSRDPHPPIPILCPQDQEAPVEMSVLMDRTVLVTCKFI